MAHRQQSALKESDAGKQAFYYWALNDVATCLYIKGKALRGMNKNSAAVSTFREIMKIYSSARCWDARGWFWNVSEAAASEIEAIHQGVDFGNLSSETLTAKAWDALQMKHFKQAEAYAGKCFSRRCWRLTGTSSGGKI